MEPKWCNQQTHGSAHCGARCVSRQLYPNKCSQRHFAIIPDKHMGWNRRGIVLHVPWNFPTYDIKLFRRYNMTRHTHTHTAYRYFIESVPNSCLFRFTCLRFWGWDPAASPEPVTGPRYATHMKSKWDSIGWEYVSWPTFVFRTYVFVGVVFRGFLN